MAINNFMLYIAWLVVSTIGTALFVICLVMFGKLMKLQMKIWFLAKKGYHLVEHIGNNKVRTYFYLKPVDNKFEFKSGYYMNYQETTTKSEAIIPKPKRGQGFFRLSDEVNNQEIDRLRETVTKMVYDNSAVTLRWGIPTITYVGNDPYPVNFQERDKQYGAQVIRDIYIRLLATEQYDFMRKIITIGLVVMAAIAIALFLLYLAYKGEVTNLNLCINNWNSTAQQFLECSKTLAGNSTIVV